MFQCKPGLPTWGLERSERVCVADQVPWKHHNSNHVRRRWMLASMKLCWFPAHKNTIDWSNWTKTDFCNKACRCEDWFSWGWVSSAADGWAGVLLPGSSCAYSHLAPHLIHFLPDGLDSNPLHEGTHLSGEINLSVMLAKLWSWVCPDTHFLISAQVHRKTPRSSVRCVKKHQEHRLTLFVKLFPVRYLKNLQD